MLTRQEACHAMLGIVVASMHCIAIASTINPSPPSKIPAIFSGCPSPLSRREMLKGYKEFSRRERVSTCLLRGNLDVV
jgi:hypothetical protein